MKWVEMIRLRSSPESLARGMSGIVEQTREISGLPGVEDAMVIKHALYEGDLAVVLTWDNDRRPVRTREGLMVAEQLQRYGMVDHGVWTAAPGFEKDLDCAAACGKAGETEAG